MVTYTQADHDATPNLTCLCANCQGLGPGDEDKRISWTPGRAVPVQPARLCHICGAIHPNAKQAERPMYTEPVQPEHQAPRCLKFPWEEKP